MLVPREVRVVSFVALLHFFAPLTVLPPCPPSLPHAVSHEENQQPHPNRNSREFKVENLDTALRASEIVFVTGRTGYNCGDRLQNSPARSMFVTGVTGVTGFSIGEKK
jgi:hypothetical protein